MRGKYVLKCISVLLSFLLMSSGGGLFAAPSHFSCADISNYFGCASQTRDANYNMGRAYFNKLSFSLQKEFAYRTVDCYYHRALCQLALRKAETFKQNFISAYNRNSDLNLTLEDIKDGQLFWNGGCLEGAICMPEQFRGSALANSVENDSVDQAKFLKQVQDIVQFIQRASLKNAEELVNSISAKKDFISKKLLATVYVAYAARLKTMGRPAADLRRVEQADRNLLSTAQEIVWPNQNTSQTSIWQKLAAAGIAIPLTLSPGNQLAILGQGAKLSFTVTAEQLSALNAVAAEVVLPAAAIGLSIFFIYEAINENQVGEFMNNLHVSKYQARVLSDLLKEISAQAEDVWNVSVPVTVPLSSSDITALEKALTNTQTETKTLTRVATDVKKHKTCQVKKTGHPADLGVLHEFPEKRTTVSDPFTKQHLYEFHNQLQLTEFCGFSNVGYDREPGIFGDCLTKQFSPVPMKSLRSKPEFTSEIKNLETVLGYSSNGFKRAIYTYLPEKAKPRWTIVDEVPLVFRNGNEIREIFGQLPSGFLNDKSGSTIFGKPEHPQVGQGWFRRGEHEFKSLTKNLPPAIEKYLFPDKPVGTDYQAAKVIRHIHYEELQKTDDGEYFICSHSLYYPAEFWNPYPKTPFSY